MTKVSVSRDLQLHGGKGEKSKTLYELKYLVCCYRDCTNAEYFTVLLGEYFYEVFYKKKFYEDKGMKG